MDAIHFPACSSGASAAPQTLILTAASYWHWTSTSLHSISFINSFRFFFFLSPKRILQSTARPLERAAIHIKVTRPPCLFRLPPWEYVNRSTTLLHRIEWRHHRLNMREITRFHRCRVSYLIKYHGYLLVYGPTCCSPTLLTFSQGPGGSGTLYPNSKRQCINWRTRTHCHTTSWAANDLWRHYQSRPHVHIVIGTDRVAILHKLCIQIHRTVDLVSWSSPTGMSQMAYTLLLTGVAHHVLCRTCILRWCGQLKHSSICSCCHFSHVLVLTTVCRSMWPVNIGQTYESGKQQYKQWHPQMKLFAIQ